MPETPKTNLQILRPSRSRRNPGDVFTYKMPDGLCRFGRIIARNVCVGFFQPSPAVHLVYFFDGQSDAKDAIPELDPRRLLIPPLAVNQKPWTLGYFETVARRSLKPDDVLPVHCFYSATQRKYFDEHANELARRTEPCGQWGLHSFRTVDDELSEALGFPAVED